MKHAFRNAVFALLLSLMAYGCAGKPLPDLIWPEPPDTPRVKFIRYYSGFNDFRRRNILVDAFLGVEGSPALLKPMSVHVDASGKIFVSDTAAADIFVFDPGRQETTSLGRIGVRGIFKPIGIATDPATGRIFFADSAGNKLYAIQADGAFIDTPDPPEPFKQPSGVAVDTLNKKLYVTDTQNHNIKVFNLDTLKYERTLGGRGKEEGQFNFPSHITVDGKGRLYVTDTMNGRIQVFDADGKFLRTFGELGDAPGMFARPKGVAVDSEGHIYVVDAAFNNVQIFDEEGKVLMYFSSFGGDRGQLTLPAGIAVDKDDYIYVADSWNRRVAVYEYLGEKSKARKNKR